MSTLAENLQHGYLAPAVEAAAEKSETEVASLTDLFMESRPSPSSSMTPTGSCPMTKPGTHRVFAAHDMQIR
jgi:hypothetical protein